MRMGCADFVIAAREGRRPSHSSEYFEKEEAGGRM